MSNHTPGPWHVAYYATTEAGGSSHYSLKAGTKTVVRTVNTVATAEDEANARLIAGAPRMFDALAVIAGMTIAPVTNHAALCDLTIAIARAAIAEAGGGN